MPSGIYKHPPQCGFQKGHTPWSKNKKRPEVSGKNHWKWNGGRHVDAQGYVLIRKPEHPFCTKRDRYVREHRLVIEKQLGRYLKPEEKCHHLGERDDNRPHMLMAFVSHSTHKRFEMGGNVKPEEIIFDGRKIKELKG